MAKTSHNLHPTSTTPSTTIRNNKTFGQRLSSILLGGEKGSGLPGYVDLMAGRTAGTASPRNLKTKGGNGGGQQQENPVARLKLLLVRLQFSL